MVGDSGMVVVLELGCWMLLMLLDSKKRGKEEGKKVNVIRIYEINRHKKEVIFILVWCYQRSARISYVEAWHILVRFLTTWCRNSREIIAVHKSELYPRLLLASSMMLLALLRLNIAERSNFIRYSPNQINRNYFITVFLLIASACLI